MKTNIKNLSLEEITSKFSELGLEGYRARQVKKWLYQKDVTSFEGMTNLGKAYRSMLAEQFEIPHLEIKEIQESVDGTRKYLLTLPDDKNIESVMIPTEDRRTLCVSTQVGCAMGCHFCFTGTMGLTRNLNIYEILEQVAAVRRDLGPDKPIRNIVFMGMGEPLVNTKNLYPALEILLDADCFNFSKDRITVSTVGIASEIEKFGDKTSVQLAISLHATTNEVRDRIMPVNKKFPLETLFDACRNMSLPKRKRITFEYVLLAGVNDTFEDAHRLTQLLATVKAKINLILFNEFPEAPFKRTTEKHTLKFQKVLLDAGYVAVIRKSRGRDIFGACGQLANASKNAA